MLGSLFRRVEQNVLQATGLVQSTYSDPQYAADEARLDAADQLLRSIAQQQLAYQAACTRGSDAALSYVLVLDRSLKTLSEGPGAAAAPGALERPLDLKPLLRVLGAHKHAVAASNERLLSEGMRRVGVLLTQVATLRAEFEARKSKVLDHDSYTRRESAAQAAHASAKDAAKAEARDALRKAEGKVRDSAAQVAQMSARVRASLGELEAACAAECTEAALTALGLDVQLRGETLSVEQMAALAAGLGVAPIA